MTLADKIIERLVHNAYQTKLKERWVYAKMGKKVDLSTVICEGKFSLALLRKSGRDQSEPQVDFLRSK